MSETSSPATGTAFSCATTGAWFVASMFETLGPAVMLLLPVSTAVAWAAEGMRHRDFWLLYPPVVAALCLWYVDARGQVLTLELLLPGLAALLVLSPLRSTQPSRALKGFAVAGGLTLLLGVAIDHGLRGELHEVVGAICVCGLTAIGTVALLRRGDPQWR